MSQTINAAIVSSGLSQHPLQSKAPRRQVIVLANRQPFSHERLPDGRIVARRSTSGLVTASESLVRDHGGVWIAHGSGNADRIAADRTDSVMVPPEDPKYRLRRVWLDPDEEQAYYYGFANEGLWPLCHRVHVRPVFRSTDFDAYWAINGRFADAACDEAECESPIVLVQDYHFALAPLMLRSRLPHASITTFWHIPWPSAGEFETCPWSRYLLDGLLGSTIVGFQTPTDCENFIDTARRLLDVTVDPVRNTISYAGRETFVRSYAASVDWPSPWLADAEPVPVCAREIRQQLGVNRTTRLIVGVDRLDYTKGIEEKLLCVERLLDEYPALLETFVFLQVAQPSRQRLPAYQDLRVRVNAIADRVNERFATERWQPIVLVEAHQEPHDVYRLLRAADVCYVGSLHDGMNLVAKEFVSAREDEYGVLLLSSFAGAARELTDALVVNPYDVDQSANALALALAMPAEEQGHRMRRMRATVQAWNARHWALGILTDATTLGIVPQAEQGKHLVTH